MFVNVVTSHHGSLVVYRGASCKHRMTQHAAAETTMRKSKRLKSAPLTQDAYPLNPILGPQIFAITIVRDSWRLNVILNERRPLKLQTIATATVTTLILRALDLARA
jgi:hypothetical protein